MNKPKNDWNVFICLSFWYHSFNTFMDVASHSSYIIMHERGDLGVGSNMSLFIEVTYINIKCKSYILLLRKQNMSQEYISLHF